MCKTVTPACSGIILISILMLSISGCGKTASTNPSIGVLSDAAADAGIALEQKNGYDAGLGAADVQFAREDIDEGAPQSDIQRTFRAMVQDQKTPMVALMGGTSNSATSHAAALANFFNVPMLVPTANGDNLFPSNNLWAFRLSAPGAAYANYLFGSVLTKQDVDKIMTPSDTALDTELRVAILYEQNTFGESAAVATAEAVMAQSIKIRVYGNFAPEHTDPSTLTALAEKVKEADVQLVYLICSDPALAKNLVQTFRTAFDKYSMPILVGQAAGFAARDFLDSKEAQGVYVLRQQIDRTDCPADIQSSYDAQTYAAVYLLDQAVQQANDKLAGTKKRFTLGLRSDSTIQLQREAIRDVLIQVDLNVPCLGMVAFDNTGQNKLLKLEMIHITNGTTEATSPADFLEALKNRLAFSVVQE